MKFVALSALLALAFTGDTGCDSKSAAFKAVEKTGQDYKVQRANGRLDGDNKPHGQDKEKDIHYPGIKIAKLSHDSDAPGNSKHGGPVGPRKDFDSDVKGVRNRPAPIIGCSDNVPPGLDGKTGKPGFIIGQGPTSKDGQIPRANINYGQKLGGELKQTDKGQSHGQGHGQSQGKGHGQHPPARSKVDIEKQPWRYIWQTYTDDQKKSLAAKWKGNEARANSQKALWSANWAKLSDAEKNEIKEKIKLKRKADLQVKWNSLTDEQKKKFIAARKEKIDKNKAQHKEAEDKNGHGYAFGNSHDGKDNGIKGGPKGDWSKGQGFKRDKDEKGDKGGRKENQDKEGKQFDNKSHGQDNNGLKGGRNQDKNGPIYLIGTPIPNIQVIDPSILVQPRKGSASCDCKAST